MNAESPNHIEAQHNIHQPISATHTNIVANAGRSLHIVAGLKKVYMIYM